MLVMFNVQVWNKTTPPRDTDPGQIVTLTYPAITLPSHLAELIFPTHSLVGSVATSH